MCAKKSTNHPDWMNIPVSAINIKKFAGGKKGEKIPGLLGDFRNCVGDLSDSRWGRKTLRTGYLMIEGWLILQILRWSRARIRLPAVWSELPLPDAEWSYARAFLFGTSAVFSRSWLLRLARLLDLGNKMGLPHNTESWTFGFFPYIGNVITPTVTHSIIFQRGRAQPPPTREVLGRFIFDDEIPPFFPSTLWAIEAMAQSK